MTIFSFNFFPFVHQSSLIKVSSSSALSKYFCLAETHCLPDQNNELFVFDSCGAELSNLQAKNCQKELSCSFYHKAVFSWVLTGVHIPLVLIGLKNSCHFVIQSEVKTMVTLHVFWCVSSATFALSFKWLTGSPNPLWLARVIILVLGLGHSIENCFTVLVFCQESFLQLVT